MTDHPITPPPELVQQWTDEASKGWKGDGTYERELATQAARWGADTELEACCEWLEKQGEDVFAGAIRYERRPKPLSPKKEALQTLEELIESSRIDDTHYQAIRHALEQLND